MQLQKQPNRGQCLVTAHAMCLDFPVVVIIQEIGHDGMERLFDDLEEPECFRGFHQQEIVDNAWNHSFAITQIDARPAGVHGDASHTSETYFPNESLEERIGRYLFQSHRAIIIGSSLRTRTPHAVAWDGFNIYDPVGLIYKPDDAANHQFGEVSHLLLYNQISSLEST